jgi:hypothetical protein
MPFVALKLDPYAMTAHPMTAHAMTAHPMTAHPMTAHAMTAHPMTALVSSIKFPICNTLRVEIEKKGTQIMMAKYGLNFTLPQSASSVLLSCPALLSH